MLFILLLQRLFVDISLSDPIIIKLNGFDMQQFPVQTVNAISSPAVIAIDQGIDAHFQALDDVTGSEFV